ncbi:MULTISPECIES: hypothetical protein [unclassified Bradyrhizobium]
MKGETFKGNVRAHSVLLAIAILRERTMSTAMPFDPKAFYRLDIGGVKGSGKQSPDDILLIQATRRRNPISALFGMAEPYWIGGNVEFGHALANDERAAGQVPGGARADKLQRDPALLAQFSEEDQQGWLSYAHVNSQMSAKKKDVKGLEDELKKLRRQEKTEAVLAQIASLTSRIETMKKEVKDTKAGEIVDETISRPLDAKNGILPGAELQQKLRGNRLTLQEFGFFLKTLELLSDRPRIGGHTGRGFGEFKAEWQLRLRLSDGIVRPTWITAGEVKLSETNFVLPEHEVISKAQAAFEALRTDPKVDFGYAV